MALQLNVLLSSSASPCQRKMAGRDTQLDAVVFIIFSKSFFLLVFRSPIHYSMTDNGPLVGDVTLCCAYGKAILLTRW
jgi:hypothetical protein